MQAAHNQPEHQRTSRGEVEAENQVSQRNHGK